MEKQHLFLINEFLMFFNIWIWFLFVSLCFLQETLVILWKCPPGKTFLLLKDLKLWPYNEKFSQCEVAKKIIYLKKVFKLQLKVLWNKIGASGQDQKTSTTPKEDQILMRASLRDRRKVSSELAAEFREATNKEFSSSTVRRRLLESGLKGC